MLTYFIKHLTNPLIQNFNQIKFKKPHIKTSKYQLNRSLKLLKLKMLFLLTCLLVGGAVTEDPLSHLLRSPQALLDSFQAYQRLNSKVYPTSELRLRVKLYRHAVEFVVSQNELHGNEWQSGLNFLSDLSAEERSQYLGFNASALLPADITPSVELLSSEGLSVPSSFSWLDRGAVTPPKDQAKCGSCWAFSSTAALEAAYKVQSGKLKSLSEQEYLDCVYPLSKGWFIAH